MGSVLIKTMRGQYLDVLAENADLEQRVRRQAVLLTGEGSLIRKLSNQISFHLKTKFTVKERKISTDLRPRAQRQQAKVQSLQQ